MSEFESPRTVLPSAAPRRLGGAALLLCFGLGCHVLDLSPRFKAGEIDIYDDLFAVSVVDEKTAVAVGYQGAIYWTDDGGESWHKGITGSEKLLYAVSMADSLHGWAVGQEGVILHTRDGGRTWVEQPNLKRDEGSHLFGVQALDENTAWAVGVWGSRILTQDGGETWVDYSLGVDMHHPLFVWLSQPEQEKVRAGEKVYEDVGLNNIYCRPAPSRSCWIVGEFGYIFYSTDRGDSWQSGEITGSHRMDPIILGFNEIEIGEEDVEKLTEFAEAIADEQHLNVLIDAYVSDREIEEFGNPEDPSELFDIIEARLDETGSILEDAGILSDRLRKPSKPPWDFEDFLEDDPEFLQRYLQERRADRPMIRVRVIQNPYLFTVYFQDDQNGYIAGLGGVILRSSDGGRTWSYTDTHWKQAFYSVSSDEELAIAVGEKGLVRVSEDGGESWERPREGAFPTLFTFMRDLDFEQKHRVGFIVGQEGRILRSSDGGDTWQQVLPPG